MYGGSNEEELELDARAREDEEHAALLTLNHTMTPSLELWRRYLPMERTAAPVLAVALYQRFSSRGEANFENKLLSAMRCQFGGHLEKLGGKQAA